MSLILPEGLPAINLLAKENVKLDLMDSIERKYVNPIRIAILNLMPMKITTETDFVRILSNCPLPIELKFMKLRSHEPKHVSKEHMERFYWYSDELMCQELDGLIVTGAPVELMKFEDVDYWCELTEVFDWATEFIKSRMYVCWAAQAAMYYIYGIEKHPLQRKMFGVFMHDHEDGIPLFNGFDDMFAMPHSRHTEVRAEEISQCEDLTIVSQSKESGVGIVMDLRENNIFITGHMEYPADTLRSEYLRDKDIRSDVYMPEHYYLNDNENEKPLMTWRAHANLLYSNWVSHYLR